MTEAERDQVGVPPRVLALGGPYEKADRCTDVERRPRAVDDRSGVAAGKRGEVPAAGHGGGQVRGSVGDQQSRSERRDP